MFTVSELHHLLHHGRLMCGEFVCMCGFFLVLFVVRGGFLFCFISVWGFLGGGGWLFVWFWFIFLLSLAQFFCV